MTEQREPDFPFAEGPALRLCCAEKMRSVEEPQCGSRNLYTESGEKCGPRTGMLPEKFSVWAGWRRHFSTGVAFFIQL